jgi:8-oxo-dGTP pyrophosphatase MutT (NUDIX family)
MKSARATTGFPVVGVSYQPYRVEMEGSPARNFREGSPEIRTVPNVLGTVASNPLNFDGVLTRWHGPGFRLEVDRVTGRQKLHLCVAETTYYAIQATQVPEAAELAGDAALCSRLLSLNLLMLDKNDVVLLIRRSDYVVYPGCFAGTVTGNCELVSREGLAADLDQHGLPDLLAAISREASEELGLDLKPEDTRLAAAGIIEYSSEKEISSHALVATAFTPGRARDFRLERAAPDPVEGLWELGDQFMTIDLAEILRDPSTGYRFIMWLRTAPELAPQAVGSLLLLLVARLELQQQQAARKRSSKTVPWTTGDLAQWLDLPTSSSSVDLTGIVALHPLWK